MYFLEKIPALRLKEISFNTDLHAMKIMLEVFNVQISSEFLSKIWAQIKKVVKKEYGVSIAAIFQCKKIIQKDQGFEKEEIVCTFLLDNAYAVIHNIEPTEYLTRFENALPIVETDLLDKIEEALFGLAEGQKELDIVYKLFPDKKKRDKRAARKASEKKAK